MNPKDTLGPVTTDLKARALDAKARFMALQAPHKTALVITLLAVLWVASGVFKGAGDTPAATDGAEALPRVRVATLKSETFTPSISILGRTQAGKAVSVRVEVPGQVSEIVAQKGQRVEAGAVLLRIDAEDRPQLLGEAEARLRQREIAYESARKLSKGGYSSELNVAQAKADLEAARALVTRMKRDLDNSEVKAPFAGVVDSLPVEAGDYFDKAGLVAARLLDLTTVKIEGQVTEREVSRVAMGGTAFVTLPDGRELEGRVTYIGQSTAQLTRTFPVEITVAVPDASVPEGVTAQIRLPLESLIAHKISPALLTLDDQGRVGVKTVNAANKVEFHSVELAADTLGGAWLAGLPEEIRVISVGQEFVRPGEEVVPVDGALPSMHPQLAVPEN